MNILWVIISLLHLVSISFMGLCIMRLFSYTRRYKLKENGHTLLFGIVRVEHIVTIYIIIIGLFTMGSVFLVHYLS